ncbi:dicarboxylate/amino acid:cation symporter [Novosphingobium sp. KACC 22771]|uniref:dicarboxylate/amino acid:cation symporter n=1 Tax=Novosphingobium sp. KACC 22771 TaxID=3025670 RepID=UPI00236675E1|nr:cation:dicarboxylase symporter family transporter [Novosphingobium sp. KACC 22771]WDF71172.1 cation:dicarboxylase symporter family transporter [Novosphingobium sp. KACC 22771]
MNRTHAIFIALVAGLLLGLALRSDGFHTLRMALEAVLPLGQLWVRALQMTLVPLIFAMVSHGVAQAVAGGRGGRLIGTAGAVFALMLVQTAIIATIITETALHIWPLAPDTLSGLAPVSAASTTAPAFADQVMALVPDNPVAAAAQGQIFPMVVFAILLGLAISRLPTCEGEKPRLLDMLAELARAMMIMVDWVLLAAPLGIFLLVAGMALHAGLAVAHMLILFVGLCVVNSLAMLAICYGLVMAVRAHPVGRFAAAIAPAQAMAAGTSSSMATTPVMLEVALRRLRLPEDVAQMVIPVAVSIFRVGTVANAVPAVLVAAHAAGIEPSLAQLVLAGAAVVLASVSAAGLPGAAVIYAFYAPGLQLLGAPMAVMPLYIAVIALPDPIITLTTVSADMTAVTLVARWLERRKGG